MPQLALETFVNQYIWLIIIFFSFYFFSISVVIPRISILQKSREQISSEIGQIDSTKLSSESGKGLSSSDSLKLSKLEIVEQSSYSPMAENWKTLNYLNDWLNKERKSSVEKRNKKVGNKTAKGTSAARTTSTKSKSASSLKTESGSSKKRAKSAKK